MLYVVTVQVAIRDWTENLSSLQLVFFSSGHGLSVVLVSQKRHSNKYIGKIWYMWLSSYYSGGLWQRHEQDLIRVTLSYQTMNHPFWFPYHCLPFMLPMFWKLYEAEEAMTHMVASSFSAWPGFYKPVASRVDTALGLSELPSVLVCIPPFSRSSACLRAGFWARYNLAGRCRSSSAIVCNFWQWDICKFKCFLPEVSKELRPFFSMNMKGFHALVQWGLPWRTKAFANRF